MLAIRKDDWSVRLVWNMLETPVPNRPSRHLAHHKNGIVVEWCHMTLDWPVGVMRTAVLSLVSHYFDYSQPSVSQRNPRDIEHSQWKPNWSVMDHGREVMVLTCRIANLCISPVHAGIISFNTPNSSFIFERLLRSIRLCAVFRAIFRPATLVDDGCFFLGVVAAAFPAGVFAASLNVSSNSSGCPRGFI